MNYIQKLKNAVASAHSVLCVGLDPVPERLPDFKISSTTAGIEQFCRQIIDICNEYVCAYKLNLAFFEAHGAKGIEVFYRLIDYIPQEKIIIADAKRGDIATSAQQYKIAFFDYFRVDAVTLNPLMGIETLQPFLQSAERGIYVLTLTSNPGASDILKQPCGRFSMLGSLIAHRLKQQVSHSKTHIGMVVGATQEKELMEIIEQYSQGSLLIPGVGTQGGSIKTLISTLQNHSGIPVITSSRSIIYAGEGRQDWSKFVADKAARFKEQLAPLTRRYV